MIAMGRRRQKPVSRGATTLTKDSSQSEKAYWRSIERERPEGVVVPGPGQESAWDYPRPPVIEPVSRRLRVEFAGIAVADTTRGLRVLETSSPPVYYFPPADVRTQFLTPMRFQTLCEWKGTASYWSISVRGREQDAIAWSYAEPDEGYDLLRGCLAFYAGRADACYVDNERVEPQIGDYYGGWVTHDVVGPFKGEPGSERW
jgi:uncharacterized protein (DUF427 family)